MKLIELYTYGCKYTGGEGAWEVQGRVARMLKEMRVEDMKVPAWEHTEDIKIWKPSSAPQSDPEVEAASHVLYFDGGCKK